MNNTQVANLKFHRHTLLAITTHDGQCLVAMKPICEAIGLQWEAQRKRISRHEVLKSATSMMEATATDGKVYEYTCLPLNMLNGWLFGVDASRVKPEIKERLIQYQRECFIVLSAYWQKQHNTEPGPSGLDHTAILRATIHGRVQALPKHKRIGAIHKIWIQLRQRYQVSSGTDIPASKVSEACRYVASCTLADAHLPKQSELLEQERPTPVSARTQPLQETQLERLHQLTNYVESLEKHAPAVHKAALALDSKLLVEVGETLREGRKLVQGISGTVAFVGGPLHGRTIELARPPSFFVIADSEGPQKYQLMMSGDGRNTYFQYQGLAH